LIKLLICASICAAQAAFAEPRLSLLSSFKWKEASENHGGYSGLHVTADGQNFIAITDRGDVATGAFERDENRITGLKNTEISFLLPAPWSKNLEENGRPSAYNSNAEGLAVTSDNRVWVAFEGHHRLRQYDDVSSPAQAVKNHPDFVDFQSNSGMEALAVDAQDRLYTLPERSGKWTRPFQVYRLTGKTWERWAKLPRRDRFLPTGADIGPDGKFYLVERRFEYLQGFATRIRRFNLTETGLTNEQTLLSSRFREFGNVESISVWKTKNGALRVTVLTDDNFNFLQSTQFHEFEITD